MLVNVYQVLFWEKRSCTSCHLQVFMVQMFSNFELPLWCHWIDVAERDNGEEKLHQLWGAGTRWLQHTADCHPSPRPAPLPWSLFVCPIFSRARITFSHNMLLIIMSIVYYRPWATVPPGDSCLPCIDVLEEQCLAQRRLLIHCCKNGLPNEGI